VAESQLGCCCCGGRTEACGLLAWYSGAKDEGTKTRESMARAAAARCHVSIAIHNVGEESTLVQRFDIDTCRPGSSHLLDAESNTLSRLSAMICT
jgi:hypothetical protein